MEWVLIDMAKDKISNYLILGGFIILVIAASLIMGGVKFSVFGLETPVGKVTATDISSGQATVLVIGFGLIIIGFIGKKKGF